MYRAGVSSWQLRIERWKFQLDWALWFRAVENIPVPPGALIPGPLIDAPARDPSGPADQEVIDGWTTWWLDALGFSTGPVDKTFLPPEFGSLDRWPRFRDVVIARWREANAWHSTRKHAGLEGFHPDLRNNAAVSDVEFDIGRRPRPFELEFLLIPVADNQIRAINETKYLVPEHVYDGPDWSKWLYARVRERA